MRHNAWIVVLAFLLPGISASAQTPQPRLTAAIDESALVPLAGNTPAAAFDSVNDLGPVADTLALDHLKLVLARDAATEARLEQRIDAMHQPGSSTYHQWLTAEQLGAEYGVAASDIAVIGRWLAGHGFRVNGTYKGGFVIDFSGTAGQVREAFHATLHNLSLPDGTTHVANVADPQIPAALAPVIQGVATLHDFFPQSRAVMRGAVAYDGATNSWQPRFTLPNGNRTAEVVGPYDFATIYNLLPLWRRGYTGTGVTIAVIEDSNLAHPSDWSSFRHTFGMDQFTGGSFRQVYPQALNGAPSCENPGQNGDEIEAALDAEWASATAPEAAVELVACANGKTASGLDSAILNLLDTAAPDIISDSYGGCETITGAAEIALENLEEQQAAAQGVTFFIAQGDNGPDQCASYTARFVSTGINSGDNTASAYAVDVGGTDFMAQYNADAHGIPVSRFWSGVNDPTTLQSALSYIPEIPWNDSCASPQRYGDPVYGGYKVAYGPGGFCNTSLARKDGFQNTGAGSGEPSTCFTGKPAIRGVVGGTCKGNPKPAWQSGVPGIPHDGLRDQPDIAFFAADGYWGSFYVECLSDAAQGGAACTADNDALLLGGGGTSFAAPAMAGIQALVDQKFGRQGNANYVYYALAAQQFQQLTPSACNASSTDGTLPAAACVFNDIQKGDNALPCGANAKGEAYDCYGDSLTLLGELSTATTKPAPAYPAHIGYDFPTGLGSINATRLFDAWPRGD